MKKLVGVVLIFLFFVVVPQVSVADEKKAVAEGVFFDYTPNSEDLKNFKENMLPLVQESDGGINTAKVFGLTHQYLKEAGYLNQIHKDYRTLDRFLVGSIDLNDISLRMSVDEFVDRTLNGGFKIPTPANLTKDGRVPKIIKVKDKKILFDDDWIK